MTDDRKRNTGGEVELQRWRATGDYAYPAEEDAEGEFVAYDDHVRALAESRAEVSGLRAARIAYASEFPLNADGEPDVGNVHANIRALKARAERLAEALPKAYEQGWCEAAAWADRDDLYADIGSPAYTRDRDRRLAALNLEPHMSNETTLDDVQPDSLDRRGLVWLAGRDSGLSSTAILHHMLGMKSEGDHPWDPADLGRCLRLLELFPEWKPRITEMARYSRQWASLALRWDELADMMRDEVGIDWSKGKSAPRTYAAMKAANDAAQEVG